VNAAARSGRDATAALAADSAAASAPRHNPEARSALAPHPTGTVM